MARSRILDSLWKIIIIALIAALALGVWIVKRQDTRATVEEMVLPVRVERPARADLRRELRLTSWIDAESTVTVVPKVSGILVSLSVDVGDRVEAGATIGRVDEEAFRLSLEQARIARDGSQNECERAQKLYESGSAGKQVYDQARTQAEAARAQYELALLNYQNTRIEAPVAGRIVRRAANRGALVSPSTPIVTIDAAGELLVVAQVPEQYARPFLEGGIRGATVSVPGAGIEGLPATIRHLAPYVRSDSRTFEVTCAVGGDRRALLPGMYVELVFVVDERKNALSLPEKALVGDDLLWVLDPVEGRAHALRFRPSFSDGERIALDETYAEREFIVEGQHFLREGAKVRVLGAGSN